MRINRKKRGLRPLMVCIKDEEKSMNHGVVVGNVWDSVKADEVGVYIGRAGKGKAGSPLANPFAMKNNSEAERNRVCDEYNEWLAGEIKAANPYVINELHRIAHMVLNGRNVRLQCFCNGKRCHGHEIKRRIDSAINKYESQ